MHNLLTSPLSESQIAAILAETAGRPAQPPLGDPAWTTARENPALAAALAPLFPRADLEADEPLPPLTDELYCDFFKTGARLPFENVYFERRRRLARAAIAVLLGDAPTRARLLPSLLRKLGEIHDEPSWSLPAHVWTQPTGQDPLTIDLFAAETANTLAELLVVFHAVIPETLAQGIRARLRSQIFENYADREPPFHWTHLPMNWNAVCHQGVLGAALAIEEDHTLVARLLTRAADGLPCFLAGFGNDGSTSEGPGYWSYGFGWFAELNAQLEHRTAGRLSLFEGDAKIARIARFAPLMTLRNGQLVNFSDGDRRGWLSPSLLAYLGTRLHEPLLKAQSAFIYHAWLRQGIDLEHQRCDYVMLSRRLLHAPDADTIAAAREPAQPDIHFPDYGSIVARGTDAQGHLWEFAAKAGHNDEHHNHNDCGSFLLNLDGHPALLEIGAPEYTRGFFSDQRYTFLAARSLGHSVPLVNGCEQPAGRDFAATVLTAHLGDDRVEFTVDLTRCYPPEARCRRLHRTWLLEKTAGRLTVTDTCELDGPGTFESILIAPPDSVTRDGHSALITTPGATLRVTPLGDATITTQETCPYRGHRGTDETITRLRLTTGGDAPTGSIAYTVNIA